MGTGLPEQQKNGSASEGEDKEFDVVSILEEKGIHFKRFDFGDMVVLELEGIESDPTAIKESRPQ